ncbi:hypothetical protein BHE74_00055088 [Ensete ventricosum]|nr:hypothetical protein GW17_00019582 [Ensete ventricosum]RWW39564.1 hypothetical protein BHE74_00055088 [Ensete ventricosum]
MSNHAVPPPRRNGLAARRPSAAVKKTVPSENGGTTAAATGENATKPDFPTQASGERTVKKLKLSKALTIPEGTTVSDACRRMTARRVDSVLLTDASIYDMYMFLDAAPYAFIENLRDRMFKPTLSTLVTEHTNSKDVLMRVVAQNLSPELTLVEKVPLC